jgi:hypothetical protein
MLNRSKSILSGLPTSDLIYYNIVISGTETDGSTLAQFSETRVQPILGKASDYYMAISRFSIDATEIPLFVCPVIPNPNNPNDINYTPYQLKFNYFDGTTLYTTTENVEYFPSYTFNIRPLPPTPISQDLSNEYYYIYEYTTFLRMINNAITAAFNDMVINVPGLSTAKIPYFQYEPNLNLISFVIPNIPNPIVPSVNLYQTAYQTLGGKQYTPAEGINPLSQNKLYLYLNSSLYQFFNGIETFGSNLFGYSAADISAFNLMLVNDNKNNYYYPPQNATNTVNNQTETSFSGTDGLGNLASYTAQPQWFINTQQFNALSIWSSLSSIVLATSQIPVQFEYLPYSSNSSLIGGSAVGSQNFRPILTDFVPDLTQATQSRTQFTYYANPYRLIELTSQEPLRKLDIQLFWEDKNQNLYPLKITYNSSDNIKIVFIKKELAKYALNYNGTH